MAYPEDFVSPITDCMSLTYQWESILGPGGLPNFCFGLFGSTFAGISYVLDFLPPDPGNLPSLPTLDLFITPFTANLNFPFALPEIDLGGGFSVPALPGTPAPPGWGADGALGLILMFIKLPFQVITLIIDTLINDLTLEIPGIPAITALFESLAASVGFSGAIVVKLGGCVATAIYNLLTDLLL